ncbi:hypothetical protein [Polyangium sp. 15x6]|uniref:hypothetical protein n=1 Tax=Polyangium sp. 15x6 TaxID=3042687 RepID=UPI00249A3045|nr:hypothetical protein [Polyangium sp. 15x6]MDI3284578.1 hypothetical protein [Polyangium sp. 15x6]
MSLKDVLKQRGKEKAVDLEEFEKVVTTLMRDIRKWVEGLPFELMEWSVLVQHADKRLNLPAITIHFEDDQVTVQPRSFLAGRRPQVEVSSGARAALLEYVGASGWMYSWEGVHGPLTSLTEETFRDGVLAELLR